MEVQLTPDEEARLAQIAANTGTDAERFVKDAVLRLLEEDASFRAVPSGSPPNPDLPVWHLGGVGALHRRDIYDDVR